MDCLSPKQRHKNMSHIRSKDTMPEVVLRKALWRKGIRYRKNYTKLPGNPDIAITRCKIAIFVDGDFWHGREMDRIGSNREYWIPKLERNQQRDTEVNDLLTEQGWLVLRFWESDIKKHLERCIENILQYVPYS